MTYRPTPQQLAVCHHFATNPGSLIVEASAGSGKCLGVGTPVMRFDGSIVPVEGIIVGDRLMGPDSQPRSVLGTNQNRGPLYLIEPVKGDPWVCNDVHVMTLMGTNSCYGQLRDVALIDLLREVEEKNCTLSRDWKLWRVGVEFPEQALPVEPYFVGLWLGDGTLGEAILTNCEPEVLGYCRGYAERSGLIFNARWVEEKHTFTIRLCASTRGGPTPENWLRHELRHSFVAPDAPDKIIPTSYLRSSRAQRLQLLAGLLDTDGYLHNGFFEIVTKSPRLAESYLFLARSLGFAAYRKLKIATIKSINFTGEYHRIMISGELSEIPCLVARRQAGLRKQIKRTNVTGFKATPIGDGAYFGFTLDGDGRFLLGDFTVTHNTTTLLDATIRSSDRTTLICAFNKRIEEDLKSKLAQRQHEVNRSRLIDVKTLHALGLKLVSQCWGGVEVDKRANDELVKKYFTGHPRVRFQVSRLVAHAKDVQPHLHEQPDAAKRARGIVMTECVDLKIVENPVLVAEISEAIVHVMREGLNRRKQIDYADMCWLPVACDMRPRGRYQRVIIDEIQDVSMGQFELLERFVAGGIAAFGDSRQSVYGWRGANVAAITHALREKWKAVTLPLTVSFRCAKSIVRLAQGLAPEIEAKEGAEEGIVDAIYARELLDEVKPGDFVLSRTNAPLVTLAVDAWLRGAKPIVRGGQELGTPLFQVLDKLSITSPMAYQNSLDVWYRGQIAKADADINTTWNDRIEDWYALLSAVGARVGPPRVREVLKALFSIQAPEDDFSLDAEAPKYIEFSTVHGAKGLEADRVFLLKQSFARYKKKKSNDPPPIPLEELNIEYVAITRGRKHVTWVDMDDEGVDVLDEADRHDHIDRSRETEGEYEDLKDDLLLASRSEFPFTQVKTILDAKDALAVIEAPVIVKALPSKPFVPAKRIFPPAIRKNPR